MSDNTPNMFEQFEAEQPAVNPAAEQPEADISQAEVPVFQPICEKQQPETGAVEIPKKKSKKLLWIILGSAVAALLFIVAIVAVILFNGNKAKDYENTFANNLLVAQQGDRYGYINKKGVWVIEPQYSYANSFNEGVALVEDFSEKGAEYYFVNQRGVTISDVYDYAESFSEGLGTVMINNAGDCEYDYIDKNGKVRINGNFTYATPFRNGLAYVENGKQHGFINKKGNWKITLSEDETGYAFTDDGVALIYNSDTNKYRFIGKNGKPLMDTQYKEAGAFSNGLAFVIDGNERGYINKQGKFVIHLSDDETGNNFMDDGIAKVYNNISSEWYYINRKGEIIYEMSDYESGGFFVNGLAKIVEYNSYDSTERHYFINTKGEVVIDGDFLEAGDFGKDGYATVVTPDKKHNVIDTKGNLLFDETDWTALSYNSLYCANEGCTNTLYTNDYEYQHGMCYSCYYDEYVD